MVVYVYEDTGYLSTRGLLHFPYLSTDLLYPGKTQS